MTATQSNDTISRDDELRRQISEIKDRLAGRNRTHQEVAKRIGWSASELEQVIREDGWIYEDEMLALFKQYGDQRELDGRIDEREGMQFFDDDGNETFKPYLQYRFTGEALNLSWDDRTKELTALKDKENK